MTSKKSTNAKSNRTKNMSVIKWLTNIEGDGADQSYDEFRFETVLGRNRTITIPRSVSAHNKKLYDALIAANACLPLYSDGGCEILTKMRDRGPRRRCQAASTTGWQRPGYCYVDSRWVISPNNRSSNHLRSPVRQSAQYSLLTTAGDRTAWVNQIGAAARWSSVIQLALSAAFAAPLLGIVDWQSFLLCLHGPSKSGKTTALLAAASVIGIGDEKDLPKFNATRPAMMEMATWFRDTLLPIDETATARDSSTLAKDLKSFIYSLSGGIDDSRHSSFNPNDKGGPRAIRSIALITSETSLKALNSKAGHRTHDGSEARAYDLAALADDCDTIFDRLPEGVTDPRRWAADQSRLLREACAKQKGTAIKAFIDFLVTLGEKKAKQTIETYVEEFKKQVPRDLDDRIVAHGAGSFGLIFAGGLLAIEAGLLPIKKKTLLRTVTKAFLKAFEHVVPEEDLEEAAISKLRELVHSHSWPKKEEAKSRLDDDSFIGFRRAVDGTRHYYVKRSWLERVVLSDGGECLVLPLLKILHAKDLLVVKKGQDPTRTGFNSDTINTYFKLNGKQMRWIQFKDPRRPRTLLQC